MHKIPNEIKLMILEYIPFKQSKKIYRELNLNIPTNVIKKYYQNYVLKDLFHIKNYTFYLYPEPRNPSGIVDMDRMLNSGRMFLINRLYL
jgi:hypothetical protein